MYVHLERRRQLSGGWFRGPHAAWLPAVCQWLTMLARSDEFICYKTDATLVSVKVAEWRNKVAADIEECIHCPCSLSIGQPLEIKWRN